ncbi:MAG: wax ester/triacylglycerol synthase family O-acyltransferase [Comamonadaceae bacterium]|nr:wax ester/triacylglycerol synthase family O-acyltransferase [Comamonadaceae bacterium]
MRHIALPKPGDWRQFCIQASRIHARPLDLQPAAVGDLRHRGAGQLPRPARRAASRC